ncbi:MULTISPECIES: helicase [unclassified Microbacterium]|uniref:helicase n=1 Tax=unclassified Microbacterium TaxID=2609290 RepID=UPI00214AA637|nr:MULTISPECIES: helicase [unclassified Microbacterium]MCR2784152.1 helicase [Microbacterium sp. zg.B96]WIM15013.1 helicase [Microbacterium sp. zg-B96]
MTDIIDHEAAADPVTDPRAGRDAVTEELRRRWLGPLGGDEEILDRSPVYAYLVGTLYPVERGVAAPVSDDVEAENVDETPLDSPEIDVADDFDAATGDIDDEDPGINITGAFGWAPQSMGVSFVHSGDVIAVDMDAGVYTKVDAAPSEGDEQAAAGKRERWRRRQMTTREMVTVTGSGSVMVFDGRARLSWRSRIHQGKRLTTVSLSNAEEVGQGEAKRRPDLCLFQVSMECTDDGGLSPYPQLGTSDEEDRELAFRYRHKPTYAIGHGVAVEWTPAVAPISVSTTVLPSVEVPAIRAKVGSGDVYSMRWLSDDGLSSADYAEALRVVASDYRTWIEGQRRDAEDVVGEARIVADRIVDRQDRAASRIEEGVALLASDPDVLTSFRMANRAMRWQMLRQGKKVAKDTRYGAALDADKGADEPQWRPFQLAFILSALASTVDEDHEDRELVDLIWFPTGGGKTEAYLGLAAVEMIRRRIVGGQKGGGLAVLTRYTMRLLTAQQFQRAATLICALELLRDDDERLDGAPAFSIGMWLGNSTTPGTYKAAAKQMRQVRAQATPENPFQVLVCPWCSHPIMPPRHTSRDEAYGVRSSDYGFELFCPDEACPFHHGLPVQVVDEGLYENPPTMLVATVDKLARLAWIPQGGRLFGAHSVSLPPSLIIQDELHLLSGPLGTIVGIYEAAIGALLGWRGTAPKVVASTATTRASRRQVEGLMAKDVESFPPTGLDADDNYFSEPDPDAAGRLYLGIMPQAHTPSWAVGQLSAELLNAPVAVGLAGGAADAYWTLVVYHNSLRELGRTVTILRDDVPSNLIRRQKSEGLSRAIGRDGVHELNGNVDSAELIALLARLEKGPDDAQVIDALATTNIMSVGIDVSRLGVMLVNGHTKTTSEYIQATSRVGRGKTPGLVVTMFRSGKARDRSIFESFGPYHQAFYRFVEPSSVTPWSPQARSRALRAALVILVRHGVGLSDNPDAALFDPESAGVRKAVQLLNEHVARADPREAEKVAEQIDEAVLEWVDARNRAQQEGKKLVYQSRDQDERLMRQFTEPGRGWPVMNSMRNVDEVVRVRANGERRG